jgi:hypothetical protein
MQRKKINEIPVFCVQLEVKSFPGMAGSQFNSPKSLPGFHTTTVYSVTIAFLCELPLLALLLLVETSKIRSLVCSLLTRRLQLRL